MVPGVVNAMQIHTEFKGVPAEEVGIINRHSSSALQWVDDGLQNPPVAARPTFNFTSTEQMKVRVALKRIEALMLSVVLTPDGFWCTDAGELGRVVLQIELRPGMRALRIKLEEAREQAIACATGAAVASATRLKKKIAPLLAGALSTKNNEA